MYLPLSFPLPLEEEVSDVDLLAVTALLTVAMHPVHPPFVDASQVLGTVPHTRVEVENVCCADGVDRDIHCDVTAAQLEEACGREKEALRALLSDLLMKADEAGVAATAIRSVELIVRHRCFLCVVCLSLRVVLVHCHVLVTTVGMWLRCWMLLCTLTLQRVTCVTCGLFHLTLSVACNLPVT